MVFDHLTAGSIGPLSGGMARAEVRSCLGEEFRAFKKTFLSSNTLDAFDHHAVHIYYDDADLVKGVELFSPVNFFWRGKRLLGESYAESKKYLAHQGVVFSSDDFGVEVDALGMGFYIPDISDDGDFAAVKSVYIDLTVG